MMEAVIPDDGGCYPDDGGFCFRLCRLLYQMMEAVLPFLHT